MIVTHVAVLGFHIVAHICRTQLPKTQRQILHRVGKDAGEVIIDSVFLRYWHPATALPTTGENDVLML